MKSACFWTSRHNCTIIAGSMAKSRSWLLFLCHFSLFVFWMNLGSLLTSGLWASFLKWNVLLEKIYIYSFLPCLILFISSSESSSCLQRYRFLAYFTVVPVDHHPLTWQYTHASSDPSVLVYVPSHDHIVELLDLPWSHTNSIEICDIGPSPTSWCVYWEGAHPSNPKEAW